MSILHLSNGAAVRVRPMTDPHQVLKLHIPFAQLAEHPPTEPAEQARMTAAIALALSSHIDGITAIALADHFTAHPLDMQKACVAVLSHWTTKDD
jgi:hypothetical protein